MDLVLDTATSLEFWRRQYPLNRVPRPLNERPSNNCAYNTEDVLGFCPNWINEDLLNPTDGVLHVLAFDKAKIRHSKNVVTHAWSSPIPDGSFYQRSPHAYVESPEFMFLHAASILDLPELIALGDELCGVFVSESYRFFENRVSSNFFNRQTDANGATKRLWLCVMLSNCLRRLWRRSTR